VGWSEYASSLRQLLPLAGCGQEPQGFMAAYFPLAVQDGPGLFSQLQ
jgi:hypothetical protein